MMQYKNIFSALMLLGSLVMASSCGDDDLPSLVKPQGDEINENKIISSKTSEISKPEINDQEISDSERNRATSVATRTTFSQELENDDQDLKNSVVGSLFLTAATYNVLIVVPNVQKSQKKKFNINTNFKGIFPSFRKKRSSKDDSKIGDGEEIEQEVNQRKDPKRHRQEALESVRKLLLAMGHVFAAKEKDNISLYQKKIERAIDILRAEESQWQSALPLRWREVIQDIQRLFEQLNTEAQISNNIPHIEEQKKILKRAIDKIDNSQEISKDTFLNDLFTVPIKEALKAALALYQEKDTASSRQSQ